MDNKRKEEIVSRIKYLCDTKKFNVDFSEFDIDFPVHINSISTDENSQSDEIMVCDFVRLINKNDRFSFSVCGDADPKTIAYCVLSGYSQKKEKRTENKTIARISICDDSYIDVNSSQIREKIAEEVKKYVLNNWEKVISTEHKFSNDKWYVDFDIAI